MKYVYQLEKPNFTVDNIDILNVSREKDFKMHHNDRAKHAFIYTVSGMMCNEFLNWPVDDQKEDVDVSETHHKKIYVPAGEFMFIPKGSDYIGTYFEEGTEIKIVQFDIIGDHLPHYLYTPQKINFPEAAELMEAFFQPTKAHSLHHPFYYLSCIYELLWQIDISYSKIPSKYKKLQPALSEMAQHYDRNEKIAYYASLCDMSEVNFRRLFSEYTGRSPVEYRNDLRLNNAKAKLQSGEFNVSEAAEASGFTNRSFFTRLYKKKFGYTPKKE